MMKSLNVWDLAFLSSVLYVFEFFILGLISFDGVLVGG